jgi:hypothetical protein
VAATGQWCCLATCKQAAGCHLAHRPSHNRKASIEPIPSAAKSNHHHQNNLAAAESNLDITKLRLVVTKFELTANESSLSATGHQASVHSRGSFSFGLPRRGSSQGGHHPQSSRSWWSSSGCGRADKDGGGGTRPWPHTASHRCGRGCRGATYPCRMDLPGPTTSVGTRTDYSVGPWDYPACATRHLKTWSTRTAEE